MRQGFCTRIYNPPRLPVASFFPSSFQLIFNCSRVSMAPPKEISLDFDPFEVLDIELHANPLSIQDIAKLKRKASRRLLQSRTWNEAKQQLINRAAQALERYF